MPVKIQKTDGKYRVSTPNQTHAYGTTKQKAERQARLLHAVDHGWHPDESVMADARILAGRLLEIDLGGSPVDKPLERSHTVKPKFGGGHYGQGVNPQGKSSGKFKFPPNFKVGHAMKM